MLNCAINLKEDIDENKSPIEALIRKTNPKNSDFVLSIIALGNRDHLTMGNKKYSCKSINFWEKALSLKNWKILRGFKPSTIKKYWTLIRKSNIETIADYIAYNRDNIDRDKLRLGTLIAKIIKDSQVFVASLEISKIHEKFESQQEEDNIILENNIVDDIDSVESNKNLFDD